MKIPSSLQRFPEPTLLIVCDSEKAKFFLAGGDSLEELDGIEVPHEIKRDREKSFSSSSGRAGGLPGNINDDSRKKRFVTLVSDRISTLIRDGHAAHIFIAAPPAIDHLLETKLPREVRSRIRARVTKDLMQVKTVDILKRFLKG